MLNYNLLNLFSGDLALDSSWCFNSTFCDCGAFRHLLLESPNKNYQEWSGASEATKYQWLFQWQWQSRNSVLNTQPSSKQVMIGSAFIISKVLLLPLHQFRPMDDGHVIKGIQNHYWMDWIDILVEFFNFIIV